MKRLLSILLCISMMLTLIPLSVTLEAADENFGEIAYSYLKYIDQNLRERKAGSNQEVAAAEYIFEQLESFGYAPEYQHFSYTRSSTTINSQNIIVTKPGKSEKTVIVGAHYDSVDTAGVDDNGSGVSVTLETAKRMYNVETPYTIIFVFFGAEETGLRGSAAYVNNMTQEDIANTICMINIDTVLAGTYRYMYSGTVVTDANGNEVVSLSWPFYQAMKISDEFNLGMRSNDTELNYDYPSPTTGTWSDHQSFREKNIPYLYFEASNWELLDYPDYPEYGSSGVCETETGEVMHVKGRDDLTFIETTWGSRGKDTLTAYCKLLSELLVRIEPYALLNVVGEYEDDSELESDYDGGFVHVDVNETVTVYFEGPADSVIGVFDENGELVSSESVYAAGKWKTTFIVSTTGLQAFSICCNRDGEWLDTQMEAKLISGDIFYTENTLKVWDITADNVTPEDKTDLEKAKADYENALEGNGGHYTEDVKKFIKDEIKRIDDAKEALNAVFAALVAKDMVNGMGEGIFAPNGNLSRAMLVAILWILEGKPQVNYLMTFEDVEQDSWYSEAIRWAASEKIVLGHSAESFKPNDDITREQLAAIIYRYEQYKGGGFTGAWMFRMDYTDLEDVADWAYEAMCWCIMNGIINGKPGKILDPLGTVTRAEAVAMLHRYCEKDK